MSILGFVGLRYIPTSEVKHMASEANHFSRHVDIIQNLIDSNPNSRAVTSDSLKNLKIVAQAEVAHYTLKSRFVVTNPIRFGIAISVAALGAVYGFYKAYQYFTTPAPTQPARDNK